jgi:hypothetical protein
VIVSGHQNLALIRDTIVRARESGQLGGYAGDVWFPQPAPKDHPGAASARRSADVLYLIQIRPVAFGFHVVAVDEPQ